MTHRAERVARSPAPLPAGEEEELEQTERLPEAHEFQQEALAALARSREDGCQRALVVLATGLGKTWLAAFDVHAFASARGKRLPRVLFLAHRAELLRQAAETFRRLLHAEYPGARLGWYAGARGELDADVVLASIQKLARPEGLDQLTLLARPGAAAPFDYVVVDEVHHAAAPSYRKILERLSPAFLLGLTATPDRADNGDVLGLFDDHVAYRADVGAGIARGRLVPFAYFGLKDDVDYRPENIPWRNRRFDQESLERAVQTRRRMEQLWEAWGAHPGTRTLVFCCSIRHATFVRDWLCAQGVRVEAVYSAPGSADRAESLAALAEGKLDALCAVDLFNEGVDLPLLDRVVMLRPTESPVVFLQQLGRGLRRADGKRRLTVIDFVGNHRVFLGRVRALLSLARAEVSLASFVKAPDQLELPPGCSIDIELEAIALLEKLLPHGQTEVERAYRELYATRGERPTAGELFRLGYLPSTLRPRYGGWFNFIAAEGHLGPVELRVREQARAWLDHLEAAEVSSCFKLVVLEALLEAGALARGLELDELARRSHGILLRSPELLRDVEDSEELKDPRRPAPERWLSYWNKHAVAAWTERGESQRAWFVVEGNRLSSRLPVLPEDGAVLAEMTRELVDYRLARYRARRREDETGASFECNTQHQRLPWADLLRCIYEVDVLTCGKCGGRRRVLAHITGRSP